METEAVEAMPAWTEETNRLHRKCLGTDGPRGVGFSGEEVAATEGGGKVRGMMDRLRKFEPTGTNSGRGSARRRAALPEDPSRRCRALPTQDEAPRKARRPALLCCENRWLW